ncbi:MAG: hypothetical protein ABMA64_17525, partial [Myxococcota bacterium]
RWGGRAWGCALHGAGSVPELVAAVGLALAIPAGVARTNEELVTRIGAALEYHGRALLWLDDIEPDPAALPVLARWTAGAPELRILATARHRWAGWPELAVPPLRSELAEALFVDRARARWPAFQPDEATVALCAELDGLPLALELAAARTAVLSPAEILARLPRDVDVLGGTAGASLERALAWSWDQLEPAHRRALSRVTVFVEPFSAEAGEAVGGDLDLLHALADRAWLQRIGGADGVTLRLAAPARAFVAARAPADDDARAAHLAWFEARLRSDRDRLAVVHAVELRAAMAFALTHDPDRAADLASELSLALDWRSTHEERTEWLGRALAAGPSHERRARLRMHLVSQLCGAGLHAAARVEVERAHEDAAAAGTPLARGYAWCAEGAYHFRTAAYSSAIQAYEAALSQELNVGLRVSATLNLGSTLFHQARYEAALSRMREGLVLAREAKMRRSEAGALNGVALCLGRLEGPEVAEPWASESERAYLECGDVRGVVISLLNRAFRAALLRDSDEVERATAESDALAGPLGDSTALGVAAHQRGSSLLDRGELDAAVRQFERALGHFVVGDVRQHHAHVRLGLAVAHALQRRPSAAAELAAIDASAANPRAIGLAFADFVTGGDGAAFDQATLGLDDPLYPALRAAFAGDEAPLSALAPRSADARLALAIRAAYRR